MANITLIKPVGNATVTQAFGANPGAYKRYGQAGHNGIDYGVNEGTPVYAAAPGKVFKLGIDPVGYGHYVMVQHDGGWYTLYGHLSNIKVQLKEQVYTTDILGLSGNTGNSTGPHLHFELRAPYVNPGYPQGAVDPSAFYPAEERAKKEPAKDDGIVEVLINGLNLRVAPSLTANVVAKLNAGAKIDQAGEPVVKDGITWIPVKGWVAEGLSGVKYVK